MDSSSSNLTAWLAAEFPEAQKFCPIGKGGQKIVLSCEHAHFGLVALKLFSPNHDPSKAEREILALKEIACQSLPGFIQSGQIASPMGPVVYIIEELIQGNDLRHDLLSGPIKSNTILVLLRNILNVLCIAEEKGIVHRDIKPANIIVTDSRIVVIDFGLARHLELSSLTDTASPFGKFTPGYAPPEQFRNFKEDIDIRADLFALGVTAIECAAGFNPFLRSANNAMEILQNVEKVDLAPISAYNEDLSRLDTLITSMVSRLRHRRPRTAKDALEWFEECTMKEE